MTQFHLTFSPVFLESFEAYLLNEEHLKEFFGRIGAITFNDYCSFYYSPNIHRELLSFFENIGELGYATAFLSMLDSENVEEVSKGNMGGIIFRYLGYGGFAQLTMDEAIIPIYELENIALIDFSDKKETYDLQFILDQEGKLLQPKQWPALPTFSDFIEWTTKILPRTFDETMNKKHKVDGKSGFGSDILCSLDEANRVLQVAFHKKSAHEDWLFFYHQPKTKKPILFFKSSNSFCFHGYHITEQETRIKGIDVEKLRIHSLFVE